MNSTGKANIDWRSHPSTAAQMGFSNGSAPRADYSSAERYEQEKERIFRRAWLLVAREEDVAEPGDFITTRVPTLKASVVITRGKDGKVRAFHNACSHRGVALVCEKAGNSLTFRCPYHAWVYGADGSLRAIPSEQDFPHVDKALNGLAPIHLESWNGFLFLNFSEGEPEIDFTAFMAGMDEVYAGIRFSDYSAVVRYQEEVSANWKLLINAFNEGYHIPFLHLRTLVPQLLTDDNPFLQYHDIRLFGPHSSSTLQRNYDWMPGGTVQQFAIRHMLPTSVPDMDADDPGAGTLTGHPGVNAVGIDNFGTEVITIFPNVILQPLANGYLLFTHWPTGPDTQIIDVRVHSKAHPAGLREEFAAANMLAATRDVLTEDIAMSQVQQRGLNEPIARGVYFGENEAHLRFFSKAVTAFMEGGPASG